MKGSRQNPVFTPTAAQRSKARTAARQQLDATENLRETNVELREENPKTSPEDLVNIFCGGSMSSS